MNPYLKDGTLDKDKPTHRASFYGIPCYFNERTAALWGTNKLFDMLIVPAAALHNVFSCLAGGGIAFPIRIKKRL